MSFIVIVCSKCKWARGAKEDSKRVKCTHCGATIDVQLARPFARADNALDLAKAVGKVNQKVLGKGRTALRTQRPRDMPSKEPPRPKPKGDREVIMDLARCKGIFTIDDVLMALATSKGIGVSEVDKDKAQRTLNELLTKGLIFESSYNNFKIV
jgi:hypothetical protein